MGDTSINTKQRWNSAHYTQLKISVAPELASAFKAACAADNVSMVSTLSQFMTKYCKVADKSRPSAKYSSRHLRRAAMNTLIQIHGCLNNCGFS